MCWVVLQREVHEFVKINSSAWSGDFKDPWVAFVATRVFPDQIAIFGIRHDSGFWDFVEIAGDQIVERIGRVSFGFGILVDCINKRSASFSEVVESGLSNFFANQKTSKSER